MVAAQQDDAVCRAAFQSSVQSAASACASLDEGQVCLASGVAQSTAFPDEAISFVQPGDVAAASAIQAVTLSASNDDDEAGIIITRIRADLPAGQTAQLIFFGDIVLENLATPPLTIPGRVVAGANIRDLPSAQAALLGSTAAGSIVNIDGHLPDNSWYRIVLEDDVRGWIFGEIIDIQGDLTLVETVELFDGFPAPPTQGSPLRAFRFGSVGDDGLCSPTSKGGLLVQIPQGIGEATLQVNGTQVQLTSTIFLQAEAGGMLTMNVIEGLGRLSANDVTRVVPTGARTQIPLDANLMASGQPSPPEPYNADDVAVLPLALLDRPLTPPPPVHADVLNSTLGVPPAGMWNAVYNLATLTCPDGFTSPVDSSENNGLHTLTVEAGGDELVITDTRGDMRHFTRDDETGYRSMFSRVIAGEAVPHEIRLRLSAPGIIEGEQMLSLEDGCVITLPFQMTFAGE